MNENAAYQFQLTGLPALAVMIAIGFMAYGLPAMVIAHRAGHPKWKGALMSIPLVNIVVIWLFAYASWRVTLDGKTSVKSHD